jgi:hypothetical protein
MTPFDMTRRSAAFAGIEFDDASTPVACLQPKVMSAAKMSPNQNFISLESLEKIHLSGGFFGRILSYIRMSSGCVFNALK